MKNTIFLTGGVSQWSWQNSLSYLNEELAKCDGGDITVYIKSGGGSVFEGIDMHNALRAYAGKNSAKVTTVAMGIVASIALFIFLAGDERHAFDNSTLMGHNSSNFTWGDRHEHRTSMELLESIDEIQAKKFQKLQGLPLDEIKNNMTHEMWYMGEEKLLESKLVTKIIKTDEHLDIEFPDGVTTDATSDPVQAQKEFVKAFLKESLEHEEKIDFDHVEQSVQACYGNCALEPKSQKVVENPTVNGKQVKDSKGESPMDYKKKFEDLTASSEVAIKELEAKVEETTTALKAEKETELKAAVEQHKNELKAHTKVFTTVLASGKSFQLDKETLEANLEKAVAELKANNNLTDGFVAYTVNELVLANVSSDGAFVGGGDTPQNNHDDGEAYWAERKKKRGNQ